jgi:hypothetical protein
MSLPTALQLHHICFAADDLDVAAARALGYGAGPFLRMAHAPFDQLVRPGGGEVVWDHENAFGSAGGFLVELTRTVRVEPADLAAAFDRGPIHHLGFLAADLDRAREQLLAAGAEEVLSAGRGPVRMVYLDVPGHGLIEVLQDDPIHARLAASLASRSVGWDGSRPLRDESPFGAAPDA